MVYLFLFIVPDKMKGKRLFPKLNEEKIEISKIIKRIRLKINNRIFFRKS